MESPDRMTGPDLRMGRRLKLSALLVAGGLVVQLITLSWSHPLAFFAFAGLGAGLVGAGTLLYLLALVTHR